jgi:hypothetical protein
LYRPGSEIVFSAVYFHKTQSAVYIKDGMGINIGLVGKVLELDLVA